MSISVLHAAAASIDRILRRGPDSLELSTSYVTNGGAPGFVAIVTEEVACDDAMGPEIIIVAEGQAATLEDALVLLAKSLADAGYIAEAVNAP